jgi:hypothetical protein
MSTPGTARVRLVDGVPGPGRTTATLLASLAARLATLHFATGAQAVGSLVAGLAALGRAVAATADGARLKQAIEAGRAGTNGEAVWSALQIAEWTAGLPPSPVLDHLRNDLALLLADDLEDVIDLLPIPGEAAGAQAADDEVAPTFLDCVLGLWAFAREIDGAVAALVRGALADPGAVVAGPDPEPPGPILR